ncbi:MAG: hypothetical protein R2748_25755 [Bryobacterales bacterium]
MSFAVILPDGVAVRNFVWSGFLDALPGEVVLLHHFPDEAIEWLAPMRNGRVRWQEAPPTEERPLKFAFRQVMSYGHMYQSDTLAMRFNRARPMRGSWRVKTVAQLAKRAGQAAAAVGALDAVERIAHRVQAGSNEAAACRHLLEQIGAKVLFCANQRAPEIVPLVLAARGLGIPTATFIASWDNLTSKGASSHHSTITSFGGRACATSCCAITLRE